MAAGNHEQGVPEEKGKADGKQLWNQFFVLRQQVESLKKENGKLEQEWNAKKGMAKAPAVATDYKDLILKKTKDAIVILNRQKEADLERIRQEFEAGKMEREARVRQIDEETEMYRNLLEVVLDELEKVACQIDDSPYPYRMQDTAARETHPLQASLPAEPVLRAEAPGAPGASASADEADRTVAAALSEDLTVVADLLPEESPDSPEALETAGFWDSIDLYMDADEQAAAPAPASHELENEHGRGHENGHGHGSEHGGRERLEAAAQEAGVVTVMAAPSEPHLAGVLPAAADMDAPSRGSKVVPLKSPASAEKRKEEHHPATPFTEEIEMIKTQYIVGNRAGVDLYDHLGHIIVRRNATITLDVVHRAEAEGKLADLIVQMVLPGFEGEEHE